MAVQGRGPRPGPPVEGRADGSQAADVQAQHDARTYHGTTPLSLSLSFSPILPCASAYRDIKHVSHNIARALNSDSVRPAGRRGAAAVECLAATGFRAARFQAELYGAIPSHDKAVQIKGHCTQIKGDKTLDV